MGTDTKKEIADLTQIVENWKNCYVRIAQEEGGNGGYLVDELMFEIQDWLVPYVTRLVQIEYITEQEAAEFMVVCWGKVEELRQVTGG